MYYDQLEVFEREKLFEKVFESEKLTHANKILKNMLLERAERLGLFQPEMKLNPKMVVAVCKPWASQA